MSLKGERLPSILTTLVVLMFTTAGLSFSTRSASDPGAAAPPIVDGKTVFGVVAGAACALAPSAPA